MKQSRLSWIGVYESGYRGVNVRVVIGFSKVCDDTHFRQVFGLILRDLEFGVHLRY